MKMGSMSIPSKSEGYYLLIILQEELSNSSIASPKGDDLSSMPLSEASSRMPLVDRRVTRSATASGSTSMPPPSTRVSGSRKRKHRDEDEEAYRGRHDSTAQSIVPQVMCKPVPVKLF